MSNKPKRYQVSAVPVGGEERVTGYLVHTGDYPAGDESDEYLRDYYVITNGYTQDEIIPETIEPVRVKPIFDPTEYLPESIYCPNCNCDLMGGIDPDAEHDPPYCWECGQAISWDD